MNTSGDGGHLAAGSPISNRLFNGRGTSDLGAITHSLIGAYLHVVTPTEQPDVQAEQASLETALGHMHQAARAVISSNPVRVRTMATEAVGLARRYLLGFAPALPWRLLAVEYPTGRGPVDLAWIHEVTREVFFDEVKTSRVTSGRRVPPTWLEQASRYAAAGVEEFGGQFLGTRLVPLGTPGTVRLVRHRQAPSLLAPTTAEPLRQAPAWVMSR